MGLGQLVELGGHLDRLAVALVALPGGGPLRLEPLGLARLLEERPALGHAPLGLGASLAGARQRVAVPLELGEGELALLDGRGGLGDRRLGDLEPARVLVALRRQVVDRPLELLLGAARCRGRRR